MSDPVEIVAAAARETPWVSVPLERRQIRAGLAALRADGWRLVRGDVCDDPDHDLVWGDGYDGCRCRETRITEEWTG